MDNYPFVSVAMATYNGSAYIQQQLDSIIDQQYKNFELVISDDNSSDNTVEIIKEYAKVDNRISIVLNSDRIGYVGNYERAVCFCKGDIILLSDQDDIWTKEKIGVLIEEIDGSLLVHSDAELIDDQGSVLAASYNKLKRPFLRDDAFLSLLTGNYITGCTIAFKKELLADALPFPKELPHDYWLALVAAAKGGVKSCTKILTKYRQHSNNTIGACYLEGGKNKLNMKHDRSESKLSQAMTKQDKIQKLVYLLDHRLDNKRKNMALGLVDYYSSYYMKAIRLSSFIFFCRNYHRLFNKQKGVELLKKAASSMIGYRVEKFLGLFRSRN